MNGLSGDRADEERRWYEAEGSRQGYRREQGIFYDGEAHAVVMRRVEAILGDVTGKAVLILGAGGGDIRRMIRLGAQCIEAIEIAGPRVQALTDLVAREGWDDRARVVQMDAHRLAYGDGSFDLVFGGAILHHLNVAKALEEVRRVLRSGGRAIFVEPLRLNPFLGVYRLLTPGSRTKEERPLGPGDVALMATKFRKIHWESFYFLALAAFTFRVLWKNERWFNGALWLFSSLDRHLAAVFPLAKHLYWIACFELTV